MKIKVLLSQGQGRLHFTEACASLKNANVDIYTLTGWIPKLMPKVFIDLIGKMFGKSNLSKRLSFRQQPELGAGHVISCAIPEFYLYTLLILAKFKVISEDLALFKGWQAWGHNSKNHLNGFRLFHVRSGAGQGGAILEAKKRGIKVITDHSIAHPLSIEEYLKPEYIKLNCPFDLDPKSKFWNMILKDCQEADLLLVNSNFVLETFVKHGFLKSKIKVVYLGVRDDFFSLKKNWALNKIPRLLFTGNFSIRKGCITIIEALSILNGQGVSIILDVVGNFTERMHIEKKYKLPENINFHGNVLQDKLKDYLEESDIYIFPTLAEGSARSAMEAMAAGLPVITTHNCGSPIVTEETGILIPINDALSLANSIKRLLNNEVLRKQLGQNASNLIKENFKWSDYAENLKTVYSNLNN